MCGIAGLWSKNGALDRTDFESALALMKHRGPDEQHSIIKPNFNLGTQRLKIIGPDSGSQPMYDDLGNYLVFNGAIYNYPEIGKLLNISSKSDTKILFELIRKEGVPKALETVRGMFAFAFYDEKNSSFLLARDRMGQKPLYYYQDNSRFLFASELASLKQLMNLNGIEVSIDENAIYHYLCFSNIPEPTTVYKKVFAVAPGHLLQYKNGELTISSYWKHNYLPKEKLSFEETKEKTARTIEEAVRIRLRADVPKGLFLSGGWDSSVIAYEASKHEKNLRAFTVEYPFQTAQNESQIASKTARQYGLKHEIIRIEENPLALLEKSITTFGQPLADSSALPNLAIAKAASQHVKVMLNGDGGDELFGGYRRYFTAKNIHKLSALKYLKGILPIASRRSKVGFLNRISRITELDTSQRYLLYTTDMFADQDLPTIWNSPDKITSTSSELLSEYFDPKLSELDQLLHWDRNFNLLSGILVKIDRASMHYSVEARSPFLDHHLVEIMNHSPDPFKISGFERKHLLKSIYREILPKAVTRAPKTSFEAPLGNWLKYDFKELLEDLLHNPQSKIYNYVKFEEIVLLLKGSKYQEKNVDYILYALLVLEMWLLAND